MLNYGFITFNYLIIVKYVYRSLLTPLYDYEIPHTHLQELVGSPSGKGWQKVLIQNPCLIAYLRYLFYFKDIKINIYLYILKT